MEQERGFVLRQGQSVCFMLGGEVQGGSPFEGTFTPYFLEERDENTIVMTLSYDPELKSMLSVSSPYQKWKLHFAAGVVYADDDEVVPTSICPVSHGVEGMEIWPDEVSSIVMYGFRFIANDDDAPCQ